MRASLEPPLEASHPDGNQHPDGTSAARSRAGSRAGSRAEPRDETRLSAIGRFFQQEDLNFLLTNRIPRRAATRFMGWFSRIEQPWVRAASLRAWRFLAGDLDLSDAKKDTFDSLHDCFIRELKDGARPVDPDPAVLTSPCDAVVGATGRMRGTQAIQAKGAPYALEDLLGSSGLVERRRDGIYVTLRLKSTMYHRFHAPCSGRLREVTYIAGDTWNVNPIALKRVESLFCKNERAVLDIEPGGEAGAAGVGLTMVPVAAILVASLKLHCLDGPLDLRYRGPNRIACDAAFEKGDELGYFQHGSTILLFVSGDVELAPGVAEGSTVRTGRPLLRLSRDQGPA